MTPPAVVVVDKKADRNTFASRFDLLDLVSVYRSDGDRGGTVRVKQGFSTQRGRDPKVSREVETLSLSERIVRRHAKKNALIWSGVLASIVL